MVFRVPIGSLYGVRLGSLSCKTWGFPRPDSVTSSVTAVDSEVQRRDLQRYSLPPTQHPLFRPEWLSVSDLLQMAASIYSRGVKPGGVRGFMASLLRFVDRGQLPPEPGGPPENSLTSGVRYQRQREKFLNDLSRMGVDVVAARIVSAYRQNRYGSHDSTLMLAGLSQLDQAFKDVVKERVIERLQLTPDLSSTFEQDFALANNGFGSYGPYMEIGSEIGQRIAAGNLHESKPWAMHLHLASPDMQREFALQKRVFKRGEEENLYAHGVNTEKMLGGMWAFVNIMLEGQITHGCYIGGLRDGNAGFDSGPHGPLYVIVAFSDDVFSTSIPEINHIAYLVPSARYAEPLRELMGIAVDRELLTDAERRVLVSKIITYEEFLAAPRDTFQSVASFQNYHNRGRRRPFWRRLVG